MHTANSCPKKVVSVTPGAQFGDEEEEEDEAGPMEGVTEALPDAGGQFGLFSDGSPTHKLLSLSPSGESTMFRLEDAFQCFRHVLLQLVQLLGCCKL